MSKQIPPLDYAQARRDQEAHRQDLKRIAEILNRTRALNENLNRMQMLKLTLKLIIVHKQHPLDLERLLNAEPYEFLHDVLGILEHFELDAYTFQCGFSPRYTRK